MLSKLNYVSAKVFLFFVAVSFFVFLFLRSFVLNVLSEQLKNEFLSKIEAETKLFSVGAQIALKELDYLHFYKLVSELVEKEKDSVFVRIYQFSPDNPLISIGNVPENPSACSKDLVKKTCVYTLKIKLTNAQTPFPLTAEVGFSTASIHKRFESFKKKLAILELLLLLLLLLAAFLNAFFLSRRINFVVNSVKEWREGGILKLVQDPEKDEFEPLEKSIAEMYYELEEERKVDRTFVNFSSQVLESSARSESLTEFLRDLSPLIEKEFNLKYVKLEKFWEEKKKKGRKVINLAKNPDIAITYEGETTLREDILNALINIVDTGILSVRSKVKHEKLFVETISALANAIDAMSPWTRGHSERVARIAVEIGESLGLGEREIRDLQIGSLLHDIGKLGVPQSILNKKTTLTEEEFEKIKRHPLIGYEILKPIRELHDILPMILLHHERCNGSGYPFGKKCDEIPLSAKIVAVADVLEAMTTERPYKRAVPFELAIKYLQENAGKDKLFDPEVVDGVLKALRNIRDIIKEERWNLRS
jgi:HD-GYP domain-containing protein (c-di-GMP phosphodiesterase class II)